MGWEASGEKIKSGITRKLSYAAISDITGLDKETVRRSVKRLAQQDWVVIDKKKWNSLSTFSFKSRQIVDVE